jgi:MinD superfamily P-loop ATPase
LKELVVVSGKGGTGKTSVSASFAALAREKVMADCDVDAADLHIILSPRTVRSEPFFGGARARILREACTGCGRCDAACRFDAIGLAADAESPIGTAPRTVDRFACEGCGACEIVCPEGAAVLEDVVSGELFVSESRLGPFVHARLGIAEENSGKLVTLVRGEARKLAGSRGLGLVVVDGSPGIGCPVIASLTGAGMALVVTEPTPPGFHDMKRVCDVAASLRTPVAVCVNKWDLNPEMVDEMGAWCSERGFPVVGLIPYDGAVIDAQLEGLSVVEHSDGPAAGAVRALWAAVAEMLGVQERSVDGPG